MQWQDIETAPKDGTEVLICWFNGVQHYQVERVWWNGTQWGNDYQTFTEREGWAPSHWMPLPEPPTSGRGKGER